MLSVEGRGIHPSDVNSAGLTGQAVRGKRLNFLEVQGVVCHKFTFHEAAGSKQAFSHLHYSPQNPC
jgi:hypothetical protein